jgi:hypothetical protein
MEYKKVVTEELRLNIMTSIAAGIFHATNEPKNCGTQ